MRFTTARPLIYLLRHRTFLDKDPLQGLSRLGCRTSSPINKMNNEYRFEVFQRIKPKCIRFYRFWQAVPEMIDPRILRLFVNTASG